MTEEMAVEIRDAIVAGLEDIKIAISVAAQAQQAAKERELFETADDSSTLAAGRQVVEWALDAGLRGTSELPELDGKLATIGPTNGFSGSVVRAAMEYARLLGYGTDYRRRTLTLRHEGRQPIEAWVFELTSDL